MLELVSIDKLVGDNEEYGLSVEEFVDIYVDLVQKGSASYHGKGVSMGPKFYLKKMDFAVLSEGLTQLNRRILALKLTEDQLIEKIITTLDELEIFENFMQQKVTETSLFMQFAPSAKKDFSSMMDKALGEIRALGKGLENMLKEYVERDAPNLNKIVGYKVAARLLKSFGGLRNLALSSSSTVQIIGAEKAFFRFRKGRGTPPKHGIIYEIPDIFKASKDIAGKLSRAYSNAIVKAARADLVGIASDVDSVLKKRIFEIKESRIPRK